MMRNQIGIPKRFGPKSRARGVDERRVCLPLPLVCELPPFHTEPEGVVSRVIDLPIAAVEGQGGSSTSQAKVGLWCLWWLVCNPSALALSLRRPLSGSLGGSASYSTFLKSLLFPSAMQSDQRNRVKTLFARIDMDGGVAAWAAQWRVDPERVKAAQVTLSDGTLFSFRTYLAAQEDGTLWLQERLERQTGFSSFIEAWLKTHKPRKENPERTVKSFCFSEAEGISREAKVDWCQRNGHAVLSLQHDGIVVALTGGAHRPTVRASLQAASERALGYAQGASIKPPELPAGVARAPLLSREEAEREAADLGEVTSTRTPPAREPVPCGLWAHMSASDDVAEYGAVHKANIAEDPVLSSIGAPVARLLGASGSMVEVMAKARGRYLASSGGR